MTENGPASRRFGCPACGGGLRYDIASGGMKCDRCGGVTPMEKLPAEEMSETLEVTEFHCPQCGAAIYSTDTEVTSFCSFCGSDVVLTGRMGRTRRPEKIVPFTVSREDCEAAYRAHLRRYHLAPSELKKSETISHFRPVYVPFWSYQVDAEGPARLEGKKSYTRGDYHYDETYDLTMDAALHQKGILYDASSAFEDETAALLEHTTRQAVPFHPAYLSGFYAQAADVPGETYHAEAAATAVRLFMEKVREDNGMDSVEMKGHISENFGLPSAQFQEKLVMMPVWLLAHRQGQRVVYTAVNGASGEVVCDVPVSVPRLAGMILALAAVIFLLLQNFLTLKPEIMLGLCAGLSLLIQYQFSGAQKRLYTRKTRAFEPREGEKTFVGPAQAMLKVGEKGISASPGLGAAWQKVKSVSLGVLSVLVIVGGLYGFEFLESVVGNTANRKFAITLLTAGVFVILLIHLIRRLRREDSGPSWPRWLLLIACGAGLGFLLAGESEDLVYYACAAAMLAASAIELILMDRAHNEYASRPVPFFGKEEAA